MTNEAKIRDLQLKGHGYKRIAKALGLSENTVKSYCRRHPIEDTCLQCGKVLVHTPMKKKKKFCSDTCRLKWWNDHKDDVNKKAYYTITCSYCGLPFQSYGNQNRKYCSRACFDNSRRKEKAQ